MNHPNLVYIFADQWRFSAAGFTGDSNVKTPNMDKLAQESINFTTTISNCPICTPYRASLFTGQYPLTTGIFMNDLCLAKNSNAVFLAQAYKDAGYDTAYIGKWHLDGHGRSAYIPEDRRLGFDYWKVLECTHDYWNSCYYENNLDELKKWEGYDALAQTEDAIKYLENRKKGHPFMMVLSYGIPHNPYQTAPEEYKKMYPEDQIKLLANVSEDCKEKAREALQGYYGHISAMDMYIGKIIKVLEEKDLTKNTILVVTSDHGDCVWSHCSPENGSVNKQLPYDESIRVPFLLRYPERFGNKAGTINTPFATPDIMPTLLELSGIPIPETVEGISLAPQLLQDKKIDREAVLIASYAPFADWSPNRGGREYRGLRTERYTYAKDLSGPWLLFDNQTDPYQLNNLVDSPGYAHIQRNLDILLTNILKEQNDEFQSAEKLCKYWGYHSLRDDYCIPLEKDEKWFAKQIKGKEGQK